MPNYNDIYVLLPVRLGNPKTRLAPILNPDARSKLTLLMLNDVIDVINNFQNVFVVTQDKSVISIAKERGVKLIRAVMGDLNSDIEYAQLWCMKSSAKSILILLPDLPALTAEDLIEIVNLGVGDITSVITPSKDGGTNALFLKPCNLIKPNFGKNSFNRHMQDLRKIGIDAKLYSSMGTRLDIDTIDDARELIRIKDTLSRIPRSLTYLEKLIQDDLK
jgi:2-phospho-L-lactate guanylyltransferase